MEDESKPQQQQQQPRADMQQQQQQSSSNIAQQPNSSSNTQPNQQPRNNVQEQQPLAPQLVTLVSNGQQQQQPDSNQPQQQQQQVSQSVIVQEAVAMETSGVQNLVTSNAGNYANALSSIPSNHVPMETNTGVIQTVVNVDLTTANQDPQDIVTGSNSHPAQPLVDSTAQPTSQLSGQLYTMINQSEPPTQTQNQSTSSLETLTGVQQPQPTTTVFTLSQPMESQQQGYGEFPAGYLSNSLIQQMYLTPFNPNDDVQQPPPQ